MPTPTLYQCIQHSRIVSDAVLDDAFQEAFRRVCVDLGVEAGNLEEKSENESSDLDRSVAKEDEFDFSDVLMDKPAKRGKNMSREESLSAFLRFPDEQDSMGLDPSDYAQDFPGLDVGFDLYEATFDDPLDVTFRTRMFNGKEETQKNKDLDAEKMFDGLVLDLGAKDPNADEERSERFFDVDSQLFNLGEDAKDDAEEEEARSALELAKLMTPETQEKFDKYLIDVLLEKNAINKWQASQLCCGRSTFTLGNYRIVDLLGKGGYGRVFLARPPRNTSNVGKTGAKTRDDVAIKVLPFKNRMPLEQIGKFLREVEVSKRLNHPNLVRCFESSKDASVHYCVSEYVDGGDARQLLAEHIKTKGRLHYRIAAYIIAEAAKGLAYMHKEGVVHRDIKPGNILLMKTGEVKLADFGMVSVIRNFTNGSNFSTLGETIEAWEDANATTYFKSKSAVQALRLQIQGTPDYLAPDQLSPDGVKNPNPLWDIYSLGCTLYFMLTGLVPYPSNGSVEIVRAQLLGSVPPAPIEYDPTIPRDLSLLTMRMLEKNPNVRAKYVCSADAVAAVLDRWVPREMLKNYRLLGTGDNFWSDENLDRFFVQGARSNAPFGIAGFGEGSGSSSRSYSASGSSTRSPQPYPSSLSSPSSYAARSQSSAGLVDVGSGSNAFGTNTNAVASKSDSFGASVRQNVKKSSSVTSQSTETPESYEKEIIRLEKRNAKLIKLALLPLIGLTFGVLIATLIKLFV